MIDARVNLMIQKTILWTRAKGELHALVNVEGHRRLLEESHAGEDDTMSRYTRLEKKIDDFIRDVEDEGLHE